MYTKKEDYINNICKITCEKYKTENCVCNIIKNCDNYGAKTMKCQNFVPNIDFEKLEKEKKINEITICKKKKIRGYET